MSRCLECIPNKKKIYFDIDKARIDAKKLAVQHEKTYAIFKEGNAVSYTDYDTATANGSRIIELVSRYL